MKTYALGSHRGVEGNPVSARDSWSDIESRVAWVRVSLSVAASGYEFKASPVKGAGMAR